MIVKATLYEQAYKKIKEGILKGTFKRDRLYCEQWFADYLNISRTPVRDACLRLKRDQYIDIIPNRGIVIKEISSQQVIEISQLRSSIDSFCAAYLAERIDTPEARKQYEKIKTINDQEQRMLLELGNISDHSIDVEFIQLDLEFHKEIISFTGNRRFMEINNEIYSYINLLGVEVVKIDTRKQESVDENEAILAAIASGDPIAAFKAACYHVEAIAKRLLKMMERQEKPEAQQDLNRVG